MLTEWGPIINLRFIVAGVLFASLASLAWLSGHIMHLTLNGREPPTWMLGWFDKEALKQVKPRNVYIGKIVAWAINLFFIVWEALWPYQSNGDPYPYKPLIGNIFLLNIGGVVFELILFFVLVNFFRWVTRERRE